MKAEELKSAIQFESQDVDRYRTRITGKLEVRADMEYDQREINAYLDSGRALHEIKERVREMIMRHIYDDQRRELADAIMELFKASPMNYSDMAAARQKILNAAKRQGPSVPNPELRHGANDKGL